MSRDFPQINLMGERGILVQFEPEINEETLQKILFYKTLVEKNKGEVTSEVINTYSSLLINYIEAIEDPYGEVERLKKLFEIANIKENTERNLFYVPVCYDPEFGPDLEEISGRNKLSKNDIIRLHSAPEYTVYFTGFLPGFLYLGGLDERLHISRRNDPRLKVPKGAVGIGGKQTGIYPKTSPGGWQIIGNSPIELFRKDEDPPCEITAGDKVKFYPVSEDEYYRISKEVETGNFRLKKEKYES